MYYKSLKAKFESFGWFCQCDSFVYVYTLKFSVIANHKSEHLVSLCRNARHVYQKIFPDKDVSISKLSLTRSEILCSDRHKKLGSLINGTVSFNSKESITFDSQLLILNVFI